MTTPPVAVRPLPPNTVIRVNGVSFHQDAVRTVVEEDEVRIRHDQLNENDPHACEVTTLDGVHLGFVPKDLAKRLSVPHPGGTWRAKVREVLRGETWGLRVLVGPMISAVPVDVAARTGGLRHRGDGTVQAPDGSLAVAPEVTPVAPVQQPARDVFAKSGRRLGHLLDADETRVRVRTLAGHVATYPRAVVEVHAA